MHAIPGGGIVPGPEMSPLLIRAAAWRDRRDRFGALLAATVTAFAVEGIATPRVWDQVLVTALFSGTLYLALWAADARPVVLRVAAVVGLLVLALSIVEAVLGVLCLYLLIGLFFAQLFGAIDRVSGSFFSNNLQATPSECVYFSFTTLTTIGYGDITTAGNLGHTLAVTEGMVGQIYLVTIVSLLVGNLGRRAPQREPR